MMNFTTSIRYGVVANIAVSHTAAGGSIPPIGVLFFGPYHFMVIQIAVKCENKKRLGSEGVGEIETAPPIQCVYTLHGCPCIKKQLQGNTTEYARKHYRLGNVVYVLYTLFRLVSV